MKAAVALLLRIYSYLFHIALSLFAIGLGILATGRDNLKLSMLPWEGNILTQALLVLGILGLIVVVLAFTGKFCYLFPFWALVVAVLLIRGFFLTSLTFSGADTFRGAVWVSLAAVVAFLGSLSLFSRSRKCA